MANNKVSTIIFDKTCEEYDIQSEKNFQPKVSNFRFLLVFFGLILGFFMAALDQTIVITALGQISAEFNATNDIGWVGSAYLLTMSGFQPMYGVFADIIGHKIVYLIAITIFLIGSVLCGLSSSMFMLIMSRAVQGIGGAGLITVVLIIVTDVVTPRERAKYQGFLGVALGTATVAGPIIGGLFADAKLWRWSFYMNVFIGIVAIAIIVFYFRSDMYVKEKEKEDLPFLTQLRQVDYASLVLLMPGSICLLVALQTGGEMLSWGSPLVLTLFGVGSFIILLFIICEIWVVKHNPVLPRRMMTCRTTLAIFVAQFGGGATDYAILYFVPLQFQIVRGDTAIQSALELLSFFLAAVTAGLISGILISKTGHYRIYLWVGGILSTVGAALFSTCTLETDVIRQYAYLSILGLGVGLCKQAFVIAGQAAVPEKDLSLVTSHGQFFRILGGAFGISVSATIFRFNMANGLNEIMERTHMLLSAKNINMLKLLSPSLKAQVRDVAIKSLDKIYLFAACASGVALIAVLFVKHYDLWKPDDEERENTRNQTSK